MLSHMYPDTELYRLIGGEDYLKKSLWMKQELLEQGRGGLLVTGSTSEGEHFTYNQEGSGASKNPALRPIFSAGSTASCDWKAICGMGILWNGRSTTPCSGRSPRTVAISATSRRLRGKEFPKRDTFCCNGNFRRAVAELPQKVYYRTPDGGIALNLFTSSDKTFDVNGKTVEIKQETAYPNSGEVKLSFTCSEPVRVRVPVPHSALGRRDRVCRVRCAMRPGQVATRLRRNQTALEIRRHANPLHADELAFRSWSDDAGRPRGPDAGAGSVYVQREIERGSAQEVPRTP